MEWLNPAGAWAFLGFLPVIALYVLKRKARRTPVPSLLLWKKTEERTRQTVRFSGSGASCFCGCNWRWWRCLRLR